MFTPPPPRRPLTLGHLSAEMLAKWRLLPELSFGAGVRCTSLRGVARERAEYVIYRGTQSHPEFIVTSYKRRRAEEQARPSCVRKSPGLGSGIWVRPGHPETGLVWVRPPAGRRESIKFAAATLPEVDMAQALQGSRGLPTPAGIPF